MIVCNDTMTTNASVVALGMFDGVHGGHKELLRCARAVAREKGVPLVVQTFAAHPLCLLSPANCPPLLTTARERKNLIEQQGADLYYAPPFTPEVRDQSPEAFVRALTERWHPVAVVVGFNYTFGARGAGTPETLKALGKKWKFRTVVVPAARYGNGKPISATLIRTELAAGRVTLAHLLLGRLYARQVRLTRRDGERCLLNWACDGKQDVAAGVYRAVLSDRRRSLPVTVRIRRDGTLTCRLPETVRLSGALTLRFVTETAPFADAPGKKRGAKP